MKKPIDLIAPAYRNAPGAAEFAAYLSSVITYAADTLDESGSYVWDAPIPARAEWDREALELRDHLLAL